MTTDDPLLGARPDGPTRSNHRPIRLPSSETVNEPNYVLRRFVVGGCALLLLVGVASLIVSAATSGGDGRTQTSDDSDQQGGADAAGNPAVGDTTDSGGSVAGDDAVADDSVVDDTAVPVVYPPHHGFHDDTLYVALYGTPGTDSLGILGEFDAAGAARRAAEVAAEYESFAPTVIPTFEIIASVASFEAGEDGDYSNESSIERLRPWVDQAETSGIHVILDMQSGREAFDSQIQEYEEILLEPHTGVALDPEWRVGDSGVPEGGKIGTVTAAEVNRTIAYLDELVEENDLPQKILIVHQFTDDMISDKADILGTDNVQVIIHMDGFGPYTLKQGSYARVLLNFPENALTGWKNFYDEDEPTPTPAQTMDHDPQPVFVSYQ